jgi:hypothetical protein
VRILQGARAALIVFIAAYLVSLCVPLVTGNDGLQEAGAVLGILSSIGLMVASMVAVTAQLAIGVRRLFRRSERNSVGG